MVIILVAGSLVVGIGAVTLFFFFRRFGQPKAGGASHAGLLAALLGFIFLCCVAMFFLSYFEI
jgi:hypothetical protein